MPIASSEYVIVIAVTMSAAVSAKVRDLGRVIVLRRLRGKQLAGVVAVVLRSDATADHDRRTGLALLIPDQLQERDCLAVELVELLTS